MTFNPKPLGCAVGFTIGNFLYAALVSHDYGLAATASFHQTGALIYVSWLWGKEALS